MGSIALDIEGKRQAFEAGAAESLIALLRDKNLPVVLLSVRALSVGKMYVGVCGRALLTEREGDREGEREREREGGREGGREQVERDGAR